MAILSILLTVVLIVASILMVLIVLVQRPKQEGLGAAFGGGTLDSALGAHTTDVLKTTTKWLGIAFFISAISLAMIKTREFRDSVSTDLLDGVEARQDPAFDMPPSISDFDDPASLLDAPPAPEAPPEEGAAPEPAPEVPGEPGEPGEQAPEAAEPGEEPPGR